MFEYLLRRVVGFTETLFEPDLRINLVVVAKITNHGHEIIFKNDVAAVRNLSNETS